MTQNNDPDNFLPNPPRQRLSTGCWISIALLILLGLCASPFIRFVVNNKIEHNKVLADRQAKQQNFERLAPIVLNIQANYCNLSPNGRLLKIHAWDKNWSGKDYYDFATGKQLSAPAITFPVDHWAWLEGNTYIEYSNENDANGLAVFSWIINPVTGVITDVNTLDPIKRKEIITSGQKRRKLDETSISQGVSPDGKYIAGLGDGVLYISDKNNILLSSSSDFFGEIHPCFNGWKEDSSGYYVISEPFTDTEALIPSHGSAGPIRLFPVNPPPK